MYCLGEGTSQAPYPPRKKPYNKGTGLQFKFIAQMFKLIENFFFKMTNNGSEKCKKYFVSVFDKYQDVTYVSTYICMGFLKNIIFRSVA